MPEMIPISGEITPIVGAVATTAAINVQLDVDISAISATGARYFRVHIVNSAATNIRIEPYKIGASTPSLADTTVTSGAGTLNQMIRVPTNGAVIFLFDSGPVPGVAKWKGFSVKSRPKLLRVLVKGSREP
mgnify:CR=1 FL=1